MATRTKPKPDPAISPTRAPKLRFRTRGASLGLRPTSTSRLIEELELGLSFQALETLETNSGLGLGILAGLIGIPERTLSRRRSVGRLETDESERLLRISAIFEKAVELFEGNVAAAVQWLCTPKKAFQGETPLRYSRMEPGAREVENLIGRLENGVFS